MNQRPPSREYYFKIFDKTMYSPRVANRLNCFITNLSIQNTMPFPEPINPATGSGKFINIEAF